MTLQRLRDRIRAGAGIAGVDTETGMIDGFINEVLREFTALAHYREMLLMDVNVATTAADNPNFAIPANMQHLLKRTVRYSSTNLVTDVKYLFEQVAEDQYYAQSNVGLPWTFTTNGSNITLYPSGTETGSGIFFNYYKYPTELTADADVFPIESLITPVERKVVALLLRSRDSKQSIIANREATVAYNNARGSSI